MQVNDLISWLRYILLSFIHYLYYFIIIYMYYITCSDLDRRECILAIHFIGKEQNGNLPASNLRMLNQDLQLVFDHH